MRIAALSVMALLLAGSCCAQSSAPAEIGGGKVTAQEVIDRIKKNAGVEWKETTVDTFKAGDPQTPVTGIAMTMMATLDVLQRAADKGQNLIITHEPTFYSHLDDAKELPQGEKDVVLAQKRAFIAEHHLIIWRFHDHQHQMTKDQVELGNVHNLGWEKYQDASNQYLFTIPETTVEKLMEELRVKLHAAVPRIDGDRQMRVTRVAFSPGAAGSGREIGALEMPDVQVLIAGETPEWETVEYVADAHSEGRAKALILLGHIASEQAGMEECTRWLRTFVSEVPIEFVPTADMWAPPRNTVAAAALDKK
jgi:putative NIF3 family GTP cyclohydrolase 1 type 2